jgi:hypothetical protein
VTFYTQIVPVIFEPPCIFTYTQCDVALDIKASEENLLVEPLITDTAGEFKFCPL